MLPGSLILFDLPPLPEGLAESFDDLPVDGYAKSTMRARRFSQYKLKWESEWVLDKLPHRPFIQSVKYNKLVGGVARHFLPIDINPGIFVFATATAGKFSTDVDWQINVHQVRVTSLPDTEAKIVPEGLHRDGHEYASLLVVKRSSIIGGVTNIIRSSDNVVAYQSILSDGKGVLFDDEKFMHDTTPIKSIDNSPGFRDMFIIVFNRWENRRYGRSFEQVASGTQRSVMVVS